MRKETGYGVWLRFVEKEGRPPTKEEFMGFGYSRSLYYKIKKEYEEGLGK